MAEISIATWRKRPPNLKRRLKAGVWYFSYVDPISKKEKGLGTDFEAARAAVAVLNDRRMPAQVQKLVERIEKPHAMFHAVLDDWLAFWKVDARPSERTFKTTQWRLGKIKREVPDRDITRVPRMELAEFIDQHVSIGDHNRYRDLLERVFSYAVSKGYRDDNPAAALLKRAKVNRQRSRLSAEVYAKIHQHASMHLQHAMELVRLSLQRPDDLCRLELPAGWDGATLRIEQGKTGTRLAITPHEALREALDASVAYRIADCPALLCYAAPRRAMNHRARDKFTRHWAQCSREQLQREFAQLMATHCGQLKNPPTLYECKSLGAAQYEEAGWPKEKIQALAGHREVSTTNIYTEGHSHYVPVDLRSAAGIK